MVHAKDITAACSSYVCVCIYARVSAGFDSQVQSALCMQTCIHTRKSSSYLQHSQTLLQPTAIPLPRLCHQVRAKVRIRGLVVAEGVPLPVCELFPNTVIKHACACMRFVHVCTGSASACICAVSKDSHYMYVCIRA